MSYRTNPQNSNQATKPSLNPYPTNPSFPSQPNSSYPPNSNFLYNPYYNNHYVQGYGPQHPAYIVYPGYYPPPNARPGEEGFNQQVSPYHGQNQFSQQSSYPQNFDPFAKEAENFPQKASSSRVNHVHEAKNEKERKMSPKGDMLSSLHQSKSDSDDKNKSEEQKNSKNGSNEVDSDQKQSSEQDSEDKKKYLKDIYGNNQEEQRILNKIIKKFRFNWKKLALHSFHLCCKHYGIEHVLNTCKKLKKTEPYKNRPFSKKEDDKIISCIEQYGKDWDKIKLQFSNRELSMLRNRFYYLIKKGRISKELIPN